jgi:hypothetical protein
MQVPVAVLSDDCNVTVVSHTFMTRTAHTPVGREQMSEVDVIVSGALMFWGWLCKQDTTSRMYWVHLFVPDRDDTNTLENVILELSSDREKFFKFSANVASLMICRNLYGTE